MKQKLYYFFIATNIILIFLVIFLFFTDYDIKIIVSQQEFLKNYQTYKNIDGVVDAITYAQQLGRLDIISLILGMFGILIGIFAIGWFGFIRSEAKDIAKHEVHSIMNSQEVKSMILNITKQETKEILSSSEMKQEISNRISNEISDVNANNISKHI